MKFSLRTGLVLGALLAAGCVPKREPPPPQPRPQPQAQPRPVQPLPPPPPADWRDRPLTPGGWTYNQSGETSQAMFGPAGGQAVFVVRCDRTRRQVGLSRPGTTSGNVMTVRTTSGARNLPLTVQAGPPGSVWSALPTGDRLLDDIAFSRGRFTVEVPGTPILVIPSWPEPARVVEDCRG